MRNEGVKYPKYVDNLNRQRAGSFAASIMVEICKRAVLWSRIRSILVTNKITSKKETLQVFAAFYPFVRTSPIHFAFLGRKRKYIKSKATAKLIEKRTSIAAVRAKLGLFDTF